MFFASRTATRICHIAQIPTAPKHVLLLEKSRKIKQKCVSQELRSLVLHHKYIRAMGELRQVCRVVDKHAFCGYNRFEIAGMEARNRRAFIVFCEGVRRLTKRFFSLYSFQQCANIVNAMRKEAP